MNAPDQYVLSQVIEYPTLYSSPSLNDMRMKVFDQLFNVIGNGINTKEEFDDALESARQQYDESFAQRLLGGETLYTGFTGTTVFTSGTTQHIFPDYQKPTVKAFDMDRVLYPEVQMWDNNSSSPFMAPYPNFQQEYSLIYHLNLEEYGVEWIDAATWFYTQCHTFFNGPNAARYHGAFPCETPEKTQRCVEEYRTSLMKYESHEAISEAYGVDYYGDIEDFITRRWKQERERINLFLDQTLTFLNSKKIAYHSQGLE